MKKVVLQLIGISIIIVLIIGMIHFCKIDNEPAPISNYQVSSFRVADYDDKIKQFSTELILEPVHDEKEAVKLAEQTWLKLYGEDVVQQRPYNVFYDKNSDIWLVTGTLPSNTTGGVANILIEGNSGKVLAVWHEK